MNPKLDFNEFKPSSLDEWKKRVQKELGDKPYEAIVWKDKNGLVLEPYLVGREHGSMDSEKNILSRSSQLAAQSWFVHQTISGTDLKEVNRLILQSLNGGVNSIGIDADILSSSDLDVVLNNVLFEFVAIHFRSENPLQLAKWFAEKAKAKNLDTKTLRGSVCATKNLNDNEQLALAKYAAQHFSLFKTCVFESISIHNAGGNVVDELRSALEKGKSLLQNLTASTVSIDDASAMIQFALSIGSSYFVEIAKLRAFRTLWADVVKSFRPQHDCSTNTFIYAETSSRTQDKEDANSNLLRATTQAMSAILGGANAVCVTPHDGDWNNENSLRLARNVQHLLIEESYLNEALNAAEGSYYIEEIERQLKERVWSVFGNTDGTD